MKNWAGKCLFGIGILHTLFAIVLLMPLVGSELLAEGVFNTISGQPKREAFLWFLLTGFFMLLVGAMINFMEQNQLNVPKFVGWSLLAIAIFTVFLSPFSGAWLIFIPAIVLIRNSR